MKWMRTVADIHLHNITHIHGYITVKQVGCLQPYRQRVWPVSELILLVLERVDVDVHRYSE